LIQTFLDLLLFILNYAIVASECRPPVIWLITGSFVSYGHFLQMFLLSS